MIDRITLLHSMHVKFKVTSFIIPLFFTQKSYTDSISLLNHPTSKVTYTKLSPHLGMKLPIPTTQTPDSVTSKPLSSTTSNNNSNNNTLSYGPALALDLKHNTTTTTKQFSNNENNHHHRPPTAELDNLEGWDSILCELGLNDDNSSNPNYLTSQPFDHTISSLASDYTPPFPDLSYTPNLNSNFKPFDQHQQNNNNIISTLFGLDFLDDLVSGAQAYESNDSNHLNLILSRLNQHLRSPVGKPLQRAAFYFKEALQHLTNPAPPPANLSSYDVVQTIRATKAFSGISPISLFSAFAANQAVLDAVDGASFIHIIDFDIGFGGQWASFMREIVDKADEVNSVVLRITAVVPEEFSVESKLVEENLTQFGRELNLNFEIDFVLIHNFELLSFKSVKFIDGERVVVHLSPSVFHRCSSGVTKFVAELSSVSPCTIVVVDKEVGVEIGTTSFAVSFVAGIEYYAGMLESLDGAAVGGDCVRKIENFVVRPRIISAVEAAAVEIGRRSMTWREAFVAAGMRVVGFSQFADFQAECLLRRAQVTGFHVAKRHGEMMLMWHDRPLVATSAWKC